MNNSALLQAYIDEVERANISLAKIVANQMHSWYLSIAGVCFTIGAIALTLGSDSKIRESIVHPSLFWWGASLLLVNGAAILFYIKFIIEYSDRSISKGREFAADIWEAKKLLEKAENGESADVKKWDSIVKKITSDYDKRTSPKNKLDWIVYILKAVVIDIFFGLLIFPLFMMLSQIINSLNWKFSSYEHTLITLLIIYAINSLSSLFLLIRSTKAEQISSERIKKVIL